MMDCDYCYGDMTFLEEYESSDGTIRKLDIIFLPTLRHIRIKTIDNTGMEMNFGIDKRIIFCPMCARKL